LAGWPVNGVPGRVPPFAPTLSAHEIQPHHAWEVPGPEARKVNRFNATGILADSFPRSAISCQRLIAEAPRHVLCDFYRGVEVNLLRCTFGGYHAMSRPWSFDPVLTHSLKVQFDAPLDAAQGCVECFACRYASRKIWNRCAPVAVGILTYAHKILKLLHGCCR